MIILIDGKAFFDQLVNNDFETLKILEKFILVKKMIIRLFVRLSLFQRKV